MKFAEIDRDAWLIVKGSTRPRVDGVHTSIINENLTHLGAIGWTFAGMSIYCSLVRFHTD